MASSTYTCGSHRIVINGGRILNHLILLGHGRKAGDKVVSLSVRQVYSVVFRAAAGGAGFSPTVFKGRHQSSQNAGGWILTLHSPSALLQRELGHMLGAVSVAAAQGRRLDRLALMISRI